MVANGVGQTGVTATEVSMLAAWDRVAGRDAGEALRGVVWVPKLGGGGGSSGGALAVLEVVEESKTEERMVRETVSLVDGQWGCAPVGGW